MRLYMERQRLLWQRKQMQIHRRHRQREDHHRLQHHNSRHSRPQDQQHEPTDTYPADTRPTEATQLMPPPPRPPLITISHTPQEASGTQSVPNPSANVLPEYYDTSSSPFYPTSQHNPSLPAMGTFGEAMLYDSHFDLPMQQQCMPIDPSLVASMGGGAMTGHEMIDFVMPDSIVMDEDTEGELLAWPD